MFALHGVGLAGSTARRTVEGRQFETFVEDVADGGRTADVEQSVLVEMVSRQRQFQIAAARLAVHRNTFHLTHANINDHQQFNQFKSIQINNNK